MRLVILVLFSILLLFQAKAQDNVIYKLFEDSNRVYAYSTYMGKVEGFMASDTHFRAFSGKKLNEYNLSLFDAFTNEPLDFVLPEVSSDKTSHTITFSRFSDSSQISVSKNAEAPKGKFEVDLLFPAELSGNSPLFKSVTGKILSNKDSTHTNVKEVFIIASNSFDKQYLTSNEELFSQYGNECFACNWEKKFMLTPLFFNSRYLSFNLSEYAYTGGAHGMQHNSIINIDRSSGDIITLESFLKKESDSKLTAIITSHVKDKLKLRKETSLKEAGFFTESIPPASNYAITPYGIVFIYNPYEIGPYSMGIVSVFIPEKELKNLLIEKL